MERKKVLFLITKSNYGGAQRYLFDLATTLPKDTYEVVVALGGNGPLIKMLQEAHIRIIQIPGLQRDISLAHELSSMTALYKIIKTEQPDILHVNSSKAGLLGSILGRLTHTPNIIFTAHGWAFNEDRSFFGRLLFKVLHWLTVLLSHKTIAVSQAIKKQMNWPFTSSKMSVIHNGIHMTRMLSKKESRATLVSLNPKLQNYMEDQWIGTIAELHPIKQHWLALEAIEQIIPDFPSLRYVIVGDGSEQETLAKQVTEKGLQENVFFMGHVENAGSLMRAFDLCTLTSRSEALAYVIIEASHAGVPVVATKVGGVPEIIEDGEHGYLVKNNDPDALAAAYKKILTDTDLHTELSTTISKRAEHFTLNAMCHKTQEIYTRNCA